MKEFPNILHLLELTANAAEWLYDGWFPRQGSRYLGSPSGFIPTAVTNNMRRPRI